MHCDADLGPADPMSVPKRLSHREQSTHCTSRGSQNSGVNVWTPTMPGEPRSGQFDGSSRRPDLELPRKGQVQILIETS